MLKLGGLWLRFFWFWNSKHGGICLERYFNGIKWWKQVTLAFNSPWAKLQKGLWWNWCRDMRISLEEHAFSECCRHFLKAIIPSKRLWYSTPFNNPWRERIRGKERKQHGNRGEEEEYIWRWGCERYPQHYILKLKHKKERGRER